MDPAPAQPSLEGPRAAPPDSDIGARLQALRKMYGFSQRELAKRAGITNATISLIEQNQVSPSVASLKKVLSGFPMSLSQFFAAEIEDRTQVFYRAAELTQIGGGALSFRQIGRSSKGRKLQVIHERYEPGADTGADMLSHAGEEAGVVVHGNVEVTIGGQTRVLGPGDAYYFDSSLPHRFRNVGHVPCEIVSACTPPTF